VSRYPEKWSPEFIQAFVKAEESWWIGREDDYECVDTWRQAREDSPDEVADYKKVEKDGCCGSEDVILDVPFEGKVVRVLYGFNHGH